MSEHDLVIVPDASRHKGTRIMRAVGTLSLVVLALVGVRSIFVQPHVVDRHQSTVDLPVSVGVDTASASSVATAIARSYLTLDNLQTRTERLSQYWDNPEYAGWDGNGSVGVAGNAYVVETSVVDKEHIDVTVALFLDVNKDAGLGGWVGVKVPLQLADGHPSAAGSPRIVGLPNPAPIPENTQAEVDSELSTSTRSDIDAFFAAYAAGDVSAVSAPGAHIDTPRPLGTLSVTEWRVYAGGGQTRQGIARVSWNLNGATLINDYQITLAQVSAPGGHKWLVQEME